MQKYKKELRENRALKATEVLRRSLDDAGVGIAGIGKSLLKDISLIQNRTRSPVFELMAEVIIGNVFGVDGFRKQNVYTTPYGKRRIDLFIAEAGVAIEVKSGYVRSRKFIREQVRKDRYILSNEPEVKQVVWVCFRGATQPLINLLNKGGIQYCDIEYDRLDAQSEEIKKVVARV